jgi:hypothetical protein
MNQYEKHIINIAKKYNVTPTEWKNLSPLGKILLLSKSRISCPECGAEYEHYLCCSKRKNKPFLTLKQTSPHPQSLEWRGQIKKQEEGR